MKKFENPELEVIALMTESVANTTVESGEIRGEE